MSAINSLIAAMAVMMAHQVPPVSCLKDCRVSDYGSRLVRSFEGYSPTVYKDAAGLPTIGYGHLMRPGERIKQPLLPHDAEKLLRIDLMVAEKALARRVTVPLKQPQADAIASFTFNLGEGRLAKSTLLRRVNAGRHKEVPPQFLKWTHAGGVELKGLVARRTAEAEFYRSAL